MTTTPQAAFYGLSNDGSTATSSLVTRPPSRSTRVNVTAIQRAALYGRISDDPTDLHAGVTRQLEDGEAVAKRRDLPVYAAYRDDSISALTGKHRPGYEDLMRDAEAGLFTVIIVYHFGRLWRNRIERAQGIERLRRAGVSVISVKGPELDLSTATGRGMAGLLGEFDTMESEVKSERVVRAALQRAENGDPNGAVPYGWTREQVTDDKGRRVGARDVHHPDEAPVVAEICHRLLKGDTLTGVTRWLNEAGIPSPGSGHTLKRGHGITNPDGSRWAKNSVSQIALRPANAGLRMYHAGRPDERLLEAKVEPIITRDEWERLRALLMTSPSGQVSRPGKRRHLLTWGVGECGTCGSVLAVSARGRGKPTYVCAGVRGCTARNQVRVDALVIDALTMRLAAADFQDLLVDNTAADAAMNHAEALKARLSDAADQYADDVIDGNQLARISAKLRPQIDQAQQEAAQAAPDVPLDLLAEVAGEQAGEKFDNLQVAQQRALLEYLIEKVVLLPAKRGPGFDPATVRIVWRTPQAA